MSQKIRLRLATLDDIPLLQHWDKQPHVLAATGNDGDDDGWNWEQDLARQNEHQQSFIAELDGRPIGMLQIIDPHHEVTHYWGEIEENLRAIDIWIGEAADLNQGYGSEMMRQAFGMCFSAPQVTAILIDPLDRNKSAHRFYERLGFEFVEHRYFEKDYCKVYRLSRERYESRKDSLP